MRFELVFFDTVDPWLGRVDRESLPQQALMELVIDGITDDKEICGNANEPKDIEEWIGVTVEDGEVIEIDWPQCDHDGSLHLEWLPSSVRKFDASGNDITGTLDLEALPTAMGQLNLGFNAFTGSIGLERLPERMEYLDVSANRLSVLTR